MGLSPTHLIIVLLIALVIFGTKRLRTIGSDLGAAVKGFKSAMDSGETEEQQKQLTPPAQKDAEFEANKASSTKSTNG